MPATLTTLPLTRAALEALDLLAAAADAAADQLTADALNAAYDRADRAVREAFATDTADRNRREVAVLAPVSWIRGLVAGPVAS